MRAGICLSLIFLQSCHCYLTNNNDATYLLSRLLADDYRTQDLAPEDLGDYSYYQYGQPAVQAPAGYHLQDLPGYDLEAPAGYNGENYKDTQEEKLEFPELRPEQKQFAVNPSSAEFNDNNPDFLQYRLEAMENKDDQEKLYKDEDFQKQLQEAINSMRENPEDPEDPEDLEDPEFGPDKRGMMGQPRALPVVSNVDEDEGDFFFTSVVAVAAAASVFVVLGAGFCYHRSVVRSKAGEDVEYPAYGVTGPAKASSPAGDRKLAQSAQMYHYQHQKNQMISINRPAAASGEEEESEGEGEGEEGDYTVYECPGLASTDEMEVKNPLFNDDPTPKNQ